MEKNQKYRRFKGRIFPFYNEKEKGGICLVYRLALFICIYVICLTFDYYDTKSVELAENFVQSIVIVGGYVMLNKLFTDKRHFYK
ncbi:hypothetical protein [Priestia koreensis]|uniref:hypothetical protein n=1 Tax=Priestia koreensis TaxID=284581 RepID=UPI003458BFFD